MASVKPAARRDHPCDRILKSDRDQLYRLQHRCILYQLFLTPSTVCLAIPLYKQLELLKKNLTAVAAAITAGVIGSVVSVYVMSMIFKLEHVHYVSLLPKSITTAIGMGVSEEAGGIVTMTIVSIIITGILGNIVADGWFKLIGIKEPIAKGLALGTSAMLLEQQRPWSLVKWKVP